MTTEAVSIGRRDRLMSTDRRRLVGAVNLAVGAFALAALVAAYGLAEQMVVAQEAALVGTVARHKVTWTGPDFFVSLNTSLLIVGAASGVAGSAIQQSIVFALRSGHESLERGFVWWYLLRPMWSALLGTLVVIALNAGLVSIGDTTTSTAGVTVLAAAGSLAGLFTDQVLQRLQHVLGASDPAAPATHLEVVDVSQGTPMPTPNGRPSGMDVVSALHVSGSEHASR